MQGDLSAFLGGRRVGRVFGTVPVGDIPFVRVEDPAVARALAAADARLGPDAAACTTGDGVAYVARGLRADDMLPADPGVIARAAGRALPPRRVTRSAPISVHGRVAVLVGPGVLRDRVHADLARVAGRDGLGVANSWGAKGVFQWDSPHHLGTCGLQERDFELLGFGAAETIVAIGVDEDETPRERYALAPVVEVPAGRVADLHATGVEPLPHRMYEVLASVVQPGYATPRHPAQAVKSVRDRLPADGVVTADPGLAGFWVARAFPTTVPGSVVVPATRAPGAAAALACCAALRDRPAIAICDDPDDATTRAVAGLASALGAPFERVVWDDAIDWSRTAEIVDAAGPIVAWGGVDVAG